MKKLRLLSIAILGLAASGQDAALRYNQVRFKASHNSYAKRETITEQLENFRFRSIELDLNLKKLKVAVPQAAPRGDWFVFHTSAEPFANCPTLAACFDEIAAWHATRPGHEAVTIFFDLKDGLDDKSGHGAADLYAAFRGHLPPDSIFEPGELLRACPEAKTLQESVTRPGCAWPLLDSLQGRFILVIADGREAIGKGYDPAAAAVFIAAKTLSADSIPREPNLVFFNTAGPRPLLAEVKKAGFIGRSYGLNDQASFLEAKRLGAHHLAMDQLDLQKSPWAETDGEDGKPYEPIEGP